MFVRYFVTSIVVAASVQAWAAESEPQTVTASKPKSYLSRSNETVRGLRMALVKDSFSGNVETNYEAEGRKVTTKDSAELSYDFGVGGGYVYLPASGFGFRSQLLYSSYTKDTKSLRLDLSLAYSFNSMANMFFG